MILIKDLELLNNLNIIYDNKIIVYGAGDYGKRTLKLLKQLDISVCAICDGDSEKVGKVINGYEIISLQEVSNILNENHIIVISIANPNSIMQVLKKLESLEIDRVSCFTYFALKYTVEFHINDQRIKEAYRKDLEFTKKIYNEYRYHGKVNEIRRIMWSVKLYDMVLALTPRKVGTTSVRKSLAKASIHCIQTDHLLSGEWTDIRTPSKKEVEFSLKKEHIKIISLVREPISRAISDYFYSLFMEGYSRDYLFLEEDIYCGVKTFIENETKIGSYGFAFEWYRQDLLNLFGIDVYGENFDREKGYQIIRKDKVDFLLIKTEKLNDCQEIIGNFVGEKDFKLVTANAGEEKIYKFAYNELKRTIRIPEYILDFYYKDNAAMDHFYTSEEKKKFYKKWLKEN